MPPRKKKPVEPDIEPVIEPELHELPEAQQTSLTGEDTVTFKRSHFYSGLTVLAFAAGVLLGYVAWGMESTAAVAPQTASQPSGPVVEAPVTQPPEFTRYDIPTGNAYAIGPVDAPITIVEFSDYQCPFCRRWHDEVYGPLLAAYPDKIRLVYRHLPLTSIHPDAFSAAEAAMCAGEQDAFWPFHEKLFSSESLGNNTYVQYAQDLGLNMTTFEACLSDHKYQQAVEADSNFAVNLGIRSTPTFFINGLAVVGAQPLEVFKQVIDKELAGEIPK
ncbi:MAG TPA: DsbA family protein [Anaerolineales bacterium]|nr:DsbA family protein [Anaerolineales bacterium]